MNYQHISQKGQCTKVVKLKINFGLFNIVITNLDLLEEFYQVPTSLGGYCSP